MLIALSFKQMEKLVISYKFILDDKNTTQYFLDFDTKTMTIINNQASKVATNPDWVKLENKKCSHCPLKSQTHPNCPIAQNLNSVAVAFAKDMSYKEASIVVSCEERAYVKKTSLQHGLRGIFGLIMATSGCPHMDFLKPMARFHLPFSSQLETLVRTTSMYLLKQYFNAKDGKPADFELKGLEKNYANVKQVNQAMVDRIRDISEGDADQNAMVILDYFAKSIFEELSGDMSELRKAVDFG